MRVGCAIAELALAGQRLQVNRSLGGGRQIDHTSRCVKQRQQKSGEQIGCIGVDRKTHIKPVIGTRVDGGVNAGVVDQHIQMGVFLSDRDCQRLDVGHMREIGQKCLDAGVIRQRRKRRLRVPQLVRVAPVYQQVMAIGSQHLCRFETDAVGGAGNENGLVHEIAFPECDCRR